MAKSKTETGSEIVVIVGFLTALVGLAQTMWTTAPWWVEKSAPTATSLDDPIPPTPGGWEEEPIQMTPMEDSSSSSYFVLMFGGTLLLIGVLTRIVSGILRKRREDEIPA